MPLKDLCFSNGRLRRFPYALPLSEPHLKALLFPPFKTMIWDIENIISQCQIWEHSVLLSHYLQSAGG